MDFLRLTFAMILADILIPAIIIGVVLLIACGEEFIRRFKHWNHN